MEREMERESEREGEKEREREEGRGKAGCSKLHPPHNAHTHMHTYSAQTHLTKAHCGLIITVQCS